MTLEIARQLVADAAEAAGLEVADFVDEVKYWRDCSKFDLVDDKRIIFIGEAALVKSPPGRLIEALHELGHAEVFSKRVARFGWDRAIDDTFYGICAHGPLYYYEEQVVERLARMRARRYLGGLTPQPQGASTRYLNRARELMREEEQLYREAGMEIPEQPYRLLPA